MAAEPLPTIRIRLNPDSYDRITRETNPMIIGLPGRYYLSRTRQGDGIITDEHGATIGTIVERNNLWYDLLTERAWNSPIVAAHVYLLALAPESKNQPVTRKKTETKTDEYWQSARRLLTDAMLNPLLDRQIYPKLSRALRLMDKRFDYDTWEDEQ